MQRELLLPSGINFPFKPVNREPPNIVPSELKPVTTLMQHQGGVFVVILLEPFPLLNLTQDPLRLFPQHHSLNIRNGHRGIDIVHGVAVGIGLES